MLRCPWPLDLDQCATGAGLDPEASDDRARIDDVVAQVSEMFSRWSGYAFGGCKTVRPLDPCGECRTTCCVSGDCIVLHGVSEVHEVRLHGEVVDEGDYHFDADRGTLCSSVIDWPRRDSRSEAIGSLEVDVFIGDQPDTWALNTATELACEILKSAMGKDCRMPMRATMISSQGVTIMLTNEELKFVLPSVVAWVNTVNPAGATSPARVLSPEARSARVLGRRSVPPWR